LPSLAGQKFTLPTVREGFDLLVDAKRFLRQALFKWGFGLVWLDARHTALLYSGGSTTDLSVTDKSRRPRGDESM
jgi:hypothetical protein